MSHRECKTQEEVDAAVAAGDVVVLRGNASADLQGNATARLSGNAWARLFDNAMARLYDNARAYNGLTNERLTGPNPVTLKSPRGTA